MGTTFKIAETAARSGFNPSTLRYYEHLGLVPAAGRTGAGYRLYDEGSLARLAFISRAKQLGCTLEEITDLVTAWEGERCEPVQTRLRELVAAKAVDAQTRIAELVAFAAQLQEAAAALGQHTPDGPCDSECGCASVERDPARPATSVELIAKPSLVADPPIACTLGSADMAMRARDWQDILASVTAREPIDDGIRLVLTPGTPLAPVAELAAAEYACCMFFRFSMTVDIRGVALEVTAPPEASDIVHALFGS